MIHIQPFVFNPFSENTYVVFDETKEAAIIDPGCYEKHEQQELDDYILQQGLIVRHLLNTHCHIDHVLGNYYVKEKYRVPLLIHEGERPVLMAVKSYAANYGFAQYQPAEPDGNLNEDDTIAIGNSAWRVLFLPGHSPGHVGFYHEQNKVIISGDVLFQHSIGRTDLPGGNHRTLIQSIHNKLFTLPDAVVVRCGHGEPTTIGEEKMTNPFCAVAAPK